MAVVKIEGKEITLPDDVVKAGDGAIRAVLAANGFPAVENAAIEIVGGKGGAPAIVKVAPRSTGKGGLSAPVRVSGESQAAQMLVNALAECYGVATPSLDAWTRHRLKLKLRFGLTERESEVAIEALKGQTNREIAAALGLSVETINKHLDAVYTAAHVGGRADLAAWLLGQL